MVSIYDRGKSIPITMKTGTKWGFLDERKYSKDSELIKIAMNTSFEGENTRSSTEDSFRGKGLKQLLGFIENKGKLTIISQKGYCTFMVKSDTLEIVCQKTLKYPLQGTLIEWEIVVQ